MLEIEEKKHHLRNFSIICAIGLLILIIYVLYTSCLLYTSITCVVVKFLTI